MLRPREAVLTHGLLVYLASTVLHDTFSLISTGEESDAPDRHKVSPGLWSSVLVNTKAQGPEVITACHKYLL